MKLNIKNATVQQAFTNMYSHIFVINGQPLERVQSYKYLGGYITSNLTCGDHNYYSDMFKSQETIKWVCFTVAFVAASPFTFICEASVAPV